MPAIRCATEGETASAERSATNAVLAQAVRCAPMASCRRIGVSPSPPHILATIDLVALSVPYNRASALAARSRLAEEASHAAYQHVDQMGPLGGIISGDGSHWAHVPLKARRACARVHERMGYIGAPLETPTIESPSLQTVGCGQARLCAPAFSTASRWSSDCLRTVSKPQQFWSLELSFEREADSPSCWKHCKENGAKEPLEDILPRVKQAL
jgi:hypothetical protein